MICKQILNNKQEQAGREAKEEGPMVEKDEVILQRLRGLELSWIIMEYDEGVHRQTLGGRQGLRIGTLPR